MNTSDSSLVERIAKGDPEAFSLVVCRYEDMVYATCWRILRNETGAADVTQETFHHFFKSAERVRGCLGAWLHRVATRRAIDIIRQDVSRRRREQAYAAEENHPESSWNKVEPLVDEALETLPDDLSELLTLHFLEQKSMVQLAALKGVSQPTISRRIADALELVRKQLREQGVVVGVVPLQTILLHSSQLAPEALVRKLGKMALAHAAAAQNAGASLAGGLMAKGVLGASVAALLIFGGVKLMSPAKVSRAPAPVPAMQPSRSANLVATEQPKLAATPLMPAPNVRTPPPQTITAAASPRTTLQKPVAPPSSAPTNSPKVVAQTQPRPTEARPEPVQPSNPQVNGGNRVVAPQPAGPVLTSPYWNAPPMVINRRPQITVVGPQAGPRVRQPAIIPRTGGGQGQYGPGRRRGTDGP